MTTATDATAAVAQAVLAAALPVDPSDDSVAGVTAATTTAAVAVAVAVAADTAFSVASVYMQTAVEGEEAGLRASQRMQALEKDLADAKKDATEALAALVAAR